MDNSNSLTNSILQPSFSSDSPIQSSVSSENDTGFFESLKNINLTTWLLIILILAFLGFNIFVYLAKGTQSITNIFGPLFQKIFGTAVAITGQTVDVAAEGGKTVVTGTANALNAGLSAVQDITPNTANSSIQSQPVQGTTTKSTQNVASDNTLNKALNSSQPVEQSQDQDYTAQEASSSLKAGWCFIGEDRGHRTCGQVGVNDQCMSGDIFPSQELCINPNLRA
jgi:hypothetical protein